MMNLLFLAGLVAAGVVVMLAVGTLVGWLIVGRPDDRLDLWDVGDTEWDEFIGGHPFVDGP
jgi:hypothetical protein